MGVAVGVGGTGVGGTFVGVGGTAVGVFTMAVAVGDWGVAVFAGCVGCTTLVNSACRVWIKASVWRAVTVWAMAVDARSKSDVTGAAKMFGMQAPRMRPIRMIETMKNQYFAFICVFSLLDMLAYAILHNAEGYWKVPWEKEFDPEKGMIFIMLCLKGHH